MKRDKNKVGVIFNTVICVVFTVIIILAVFVFIVSIMAKRENKLPIFFGYSFSVVVSDSMEPEIKVGEMIFIKETDISEIETGDNVVFLSRNYGSFGERVVHKVHEKGTDENGVYLITKGVNNPVRDAEKVRRADLIGKQTGKSLIAGKAVSFFGKVHNVVIVVVVFAATAFSVRQIKTIVRLKKEKEENRQNRL